MGDALDSDRISAIEGRTRAASAGPWRAYFEQDGHGGGDDVILTAESDIYLPAGACTEDIWFVARVRQDVPLLLEDLDRLECDTPRSLLVPAELTAMADRATGATPGPWTVETPWQQDVRLGHLGLQTGTGTLRTGAGAMEITCPAAADLAFIAHARQDLPDLVEAVRHLRRELGL